MKNRFWVVTADAGRARIYATDTGADDLRLTATFDNDAGRQPGRDQESDRPGRSFDRFGQGRHAMGKAHSVKEQAEVDFARELSRHLTEARHTGDYQHLILIAAPHFLGLLREALDNTVMQHVTLELDLDLMPFESPDQIRQHLPDHLPTQRT
ncbi:MAG: host attachment protein [Pseudomonadota bacterium]|nr:host attachment protein [Pseudomonadota bacterium]